jgi:hypothetical protein
MKSFIGFALTLATGCASSVHLADTRVDASRSPWGEQAVTSDQPASSNDESLYQECLERWNTHPNKARLCASQARVPANQVPAKKEETK